MTQHRKRGITRRVSRLSRAALTPRRALRGNRRGVHRAGAPRTGRDGRARRGPSGRENRHGRAMTRMRFDSCGDRAQGDSPPVPWSHAGAGCEDPDLLRESGAQDASLFAEPRVTGLQFHVVVVGDDHGADVIRDGRDERVSLPLRSRRGLDHVPLAEGFLDSGTLSRCHPVPERRIHHHVDLRVRVTRGQSRTGGQQLEEAGPVVALVHAGLAG